MRINANVLSNNAYRQLDGANKAECFTTSSISHAFSSQPSTTVSAKIIELIFKAKRKYRINISISNREYHAQSK